MKITFIILIVIVAGVITYFVFFRMTKEKAIKTIVEAKSGRTADSLTALGDDYLIAWAKAIKSKDVSFITEGKTYNTLTGTNII